MAERPERALVYDRIEANRRRTRLLLVLFAVLLLPVVSGASVWLMPWLLMPIAWLAIGWPALQQSIAQASAAELIALEGGALATALLVVTVGGALVATFLIDRFAAALVLRAARARPVAREDELELHRVVENLCIGSGLPKPRVHVIESSAPNALATGRDPEHASLAVTRGLLDLLERRELEGVVAHELSHIRNHDVHLATTLAGLTATLTLPLRLLAAMLRHRALAVGALILGAQLFGALLLVAGTLLDELAGLPAFLRWWCLHALAAPLYLLFLAPLAAGLVRRSVSCERELLADADAVLLTRNPEALARALVKASSALGTLRAGPATAHLYLVEPTPREDGWLAAWFRSHPPIEERLALLARLGGDLSPARFDEARRTGAGART